MVCSKKYKRLLRKKFLKLFKPLFIQVIILIASFMILFNKDNFNYSKNQYLIFTIGFFTIVISEILARWVQNNYTFIIFFSIPLIIFL